MELIVNKIIVWRKIVRCWFRRLQRASDLLLHRRAVRRGRITAALSVAVTVWLAVTSVVLHRRALLSVLCLGWWARRRGIADRGQLRATHLRCAANRSAHVHLLIGSMVRNTSLLGCLPVTVLFLLAGSLFFLLLGLPLLANLLELYNEKVSFCCNN